MPTSSETTVPFRPPRARAFALTTLAACWAALTFGAIEPIQAALPNWDELSIDALTLCLQLGKVALVLFACLLPLALASAWLAPLRAPAIWTASCAAFWIQGDLFVWDYGTFDGSQLDWSAHAAKGWFELGVWLGLLSLGLWKATWVTRRTPKILAAIAVLQLAGLAGIVQQNSPYASRPQVVIGKQSPASEFATFSKGGNAIVVVLDAMQSDIFGSVLQSGALDEEMPEGFVYYRNAISLYMSTKFSLQSILTSRAVPSRVNWVGWLAETMRRSLPAVLAEQGFDSRIASFSPGSLACTQGSSALSCNTLVQLGAPDPARARNANRRSEVSLLARLAVFRLSPHLLKNRVYNEGRWLLPEIYPQQESSGIDPRLPAATRTDIQALRSLTSHIRVVEGAPRFRFLHLNSIHFPAWAGRDCCADRRSRVRSRQMDTAQCVLGELFRFFRALDAVGVYDTSAIVVVADHGSRQLRWVSKKSAGVPLEPPEAPGRSAIRNWWKALPVFLVKQPGARGAILESDHPVSLCDVPNTVIDALDIELEEEFECESVTRSPRRTPRFHYNYVERKRTPATRHFYNFSPIIVEGHSWHGSSWRWCDKKCRDEAYGPNEVGPD